MDDFKRNRYRILIEIIILVIIALYVSAFDPSILRYKNDHMVGYLDSMEYIGSLDGLLQGKVMYKDFYWLYGPLFLVIQLPAYILFGQNHNAFVHVWSSYLPFISIILSYLWARIFFPGSFLRLFFVLICIFQNANNLNLSPRHLVAELALGVFILSLRNFQRKGLIFWAGVMSALAILTSPEFGLVSLVTIAIATLILYFAENKLPLRKRLGYYFLGIVVILLPYYSYLALNGAFFSYLKYIYGSNRGFSNPARGELLPMLPAISFGNLSSFINSIYNFIISRELRFYLPLGIYFISFIYFLVNFIKFKRKKAIEIFVLLFFGVIIFVRVLTGPVFSALGAYVLLPAITLGLIFVQYIQGLATDYYLKRKIKKSVLLWVFMAGIYSWLFLTIENKDFLKFASNLNLKQRISEYQAGKVYSNKIGYFVNPKSVEQYKAINDYIERHTAPDEYIFVYPWGPYNHFTKRPSPVTARDTFDSMAGEYIIDEEISQLEERKPKYVILNTFNNLGIVHAEPKRRDVGDALSWGTEGPSFSGRGDRLQIYILENYKIEKVFDYAIVMARREKREVLERQFTDAFLLTLKTGDPNEILFGLRLTGKPGTFKIYGRNAYFEYKFAQPVTCSYAQIIFSVKSSLFKKPFSKSLVNIYLKHKDSNVTGVYIFDLTNHNKYEDAWIGFCGGQTLDIDSVKITIVTPRPYILPDEIEIKEMKLLLEKVKSEEDTFEARPEVQDVSAAQEQVEVNKEEVAKIDNPKAQDPVPAKDNLQEMPVSESDQSKEKKKEEHRVEIKEEVKLDDKLIGSTFKVLAKTFVTLMDIEKFKKSNIKRVNKMSDEKFKKKYAKVYEKIKDLPEDIRLRFDIKENMNRQMAMENIKKVNKKEAYGLIDSIPDVFISSQFKNYLAEKKQDLGKSNLITQINQLWDKITKTAMQDKQKKR